MAECEFINECPFFQGKLAEKPAEIETLKEEYCRTNGLHCARYMIATALGKEYIPADLYPHEKDIAYKLLAEHG
jgi:hypothetical protein